MKIKQIESASNGIYRKLLSLAKSRGIDKEGECLVAGDKIIQEVLREKSVDLSKAYWVFASEEHDLFKLENAPDTLVQMAKPLFKELDTLGVHSPLLCIPTPALNKWNPEAASEGTEILCALGDPNNLGALLRSAEAFGVHSVVLLEEACHPFHPKVIKSSSGSVFRLKLSTGPSIQNLKDVRNIFALDGQGLPLGKVQFNKNPRILLGEEGQGLPTDLKVQKVAIPMNPKVESLNATVAASILFYELAKK
jgi:tRNA G18 (ribose-2'-O)-methylase SpoU